MNNLMIFENKPVEVFEWNGQVLFNHKHVGECLGIKNVNDNIRNMNEKQVVKLTNSKIGNPDFRKLHNTGENFLTESGVYKLIFKSKKKEAERFQDWVTDEVLPQIRKTGQYQVDGYINKLCVEIETLKKTINEATDYYKIQPKTVRKYTDYIKKRLKITHANEEFEQVKVMLFARLGIEKWCDIPTNRTDIYDLIEKCMQIVKKERPYEQRSFFE